MPDLPISRLSPMNGLLLTVSAGKSDRISKLTYDRVALEFEADTQSGIDLLHSRSAESPVDLPESHLIDSAYLAA